MSIVYRLRLWGLPLYVVIALTNFFYLYFFDFIGGATAAPFLVRAAKDALWMSVLCFFLVTSQPRPFHDSLPRGRLPQVLVTPTAAFWLFVALYTTSALLHLVNLPLREVAQMHIKNLLMFALVVPIFLQFSRQHRHEILLRIKQLFIILGVVQIIASFGINVFLPEASLWRGDTVLGVNSIVGFFGNPNRFALFLTIGACFLLVDLFRATYLHKILLYLLLITAFGFAIVHTMSAGHILLFPLIFAYIGIVSVFAVGTSVQRVGLSFVVVMLAVFALTLDPILARIPAFWDLAVLLRQWLSSAPVDTSLLVSNSITTRITELYSVWESMRTVPLLNALLGDFSTSTMHRSHNVYLLLAWNSGLLVALAFVAMLGAALVWSLAAAISPGRDPDERARFLEYHGYLATMAASFTFYPNFFEYPISFLLFLGIAAVAGLTAPRRWEAEPS